MFPSGSIAEVSSVAKYVFELEVYAFVFAFVTFKKLRLRDIQEAQTYGSRKLTKAGRARRGKRWAASGSNRTERARMFELFSECLMAARRLVPARYR